MSSGNPESRRAARPPRWCTAEAPPPRPAYYEAADAYPGISVRTWCRMYRLMQERELLDDEPALRMARFLCDTDTVAPDGAIDDVPTMIRAYTARCRVSRQTAYTDLARLVRRGLVRQVQAAAPGRRARYRLSCPVAMVTESMPGLPADLARALPLQPDPGPEAETETGAADPPPDASPSAPCEGLDPSPLIREGSPPSPSGTARPGMRRAQWHGKGETSTEERACAEAIVTGCRGEWAAQRGPHRVPDRAELGCVERLAALALRSAAPGEVRQVLTWHVASAKDLPAMLAWRLGRIVDAARRPARHVPIDDGRRWAAMAARMGNSAPAPGSSTAADLARTRADLLDRAERSRLARLPPAAAQARACPPTASAADEHGYQDEAAVVAELNRVRAEIASLAAGSPVEQSRARALAQVWTSRLRVPAG